MRKLKRLKILFIIFLSLLIFIIALHLLVFFETQSENSGIRSFPDALWYSVVTLTTVGYGDMYPVTQAGKIIGYCFVISSLGFLGFLISKLTQVFIHFRERRIMGLFGTKFTKHIIIVGWDDFARTIVDQLVYAGNRVAIITHIRDHVELIREKYHEKNVFVLFSDINNLEIMVKANVKKAAVVFVNLADDTQKLVYILNLKKRFGNIRFVVTLDNANLRDTFHSAGVSFVLSRNEVAAKMVASYIFEPDVAEYNADLLASSRTEDDFDIQEYRVTQQNPFAGKSYGEAFLKVKKEFNSILIGLSKHTGDKRQLFKNPPDDTVINIGDYLILITDGRSERLVSNAFGIQEGVLSE